MAEIIRKSERLTHTTYARGFRFLPPNSGSGFSFDCEADGTLLPFPTQAAAEAYQACLDGTYAVIDEGVRQYSNRWIQPALLRCDCGTEVELDSAIANTCSRCDADYNMSGQRLAHRSQWGEETNETLADIFSSYDPEDVW